MCEPISISTATMAYISLATAAVAGGVAAHTAAASARTRSRLARRNALISKQRKADAFARGAAAESAFNLKISRMLGSQRAAAGASGAVVDTGAALSVLEDTAMIGELDTLQIRNNAAREAYGLEVESQNFLFESAFARTQGRNALVGGAVGTAASVFGSFTSFANAGVFG